MTHLAPTGCFRSGETGWSCPKSPGWKFPALISVRHFHSPEPHPPPCSMSWSAWALRPLPTPAFQGCNSDTSLLSSDKEYGYLLSLSSGPSLGSDFILSSLGRASLLFVDKLVSGGSLRTCFAHQLIHLCLQTPSNRPLSFSLLD